MQLGVDFGGTRIKAGLVEGAVVVRRTETRTRAGSSPSDILDLIAFSVRELYEKPTCVGVAIPGEVDASGLCRRLPNVPGFEGVNIAGELARRLGCQVVVENDAIAAALAERLFGHGNRHRSFLMATLGTGIGGGLVLDGHVRRGTHGFCGEIGHIPVDTSVGARACGCGKTGCMEAYAGTAGLLARYAEEGGRAREIREIAEAARGGELTALTVFEQLGCALGQGIAVIQNVLDLDAVVFTGGVANSFDLIEPSLREELKARVFAPPLADVALLVSELGENAGVVGAAHLPPPREKKDPQAGPGLASYLQGQGFPREIEG